MISGPEAQLLAGRENKKVISFHHELQLMAQALFPQVYRFSSTSNRQAQITNLLWYGDFPQETGTQGAAHLLVSRRD